MAKTPFERARETGHYANTRTGAPAQGYNRVVATKSEVASDTAAVTDSVKMAVVKESRKAKSAAKEAAEPVAEAVPVKSSFVD
jgi:hypothetical protein